MQLSNFSGTLKTLSVYSVAKFIPSLLGFAGLIVFTRLLGTEEYGDYSLLLTTIVIMAAFLFEWLNKSWLRFGNKLTEESGFPLQTILIFFVCVATAVALLTLGLYYGSVTFSEHTLARYYPLTILAFVMEGAFQFILATKIAVADSKKYLMYMVTNAVIKFTLAFCLVYFWELGVYGMLLGMIGGTVVVSSVEFTKRIPDLKSKMEVSQVRSLVEYGLPWMFVATFTLLLSYGDRYLIKYFLGADSLGIYSANYNMIHIGIQFFTAVVVMTAYPAIIEEFESRASQGKSLKIEQFFIIFFSVCLPVVVLLAMYPQELLGILLSTEYLKIENAIVWIAIGSFLHGLTHLTYKVFELSKRISNLSLLIGISAALNIALNVFFIPQYGLNGAAYATFIGYCFYFLSSIYWGQKLVTWRIPWGEALVLLLIAVLSAYAMKPLPLGFGIIGVIIKCLLTLTLYAVAIKILRPGIFSHFR